MCKHLLKIQRLILALLIFGGGIFYTSSATARVCFLPDSTDCGEGDVDVPDVQITCATYGGYETEAACLEARTNKTAQTCTLNSGCYYPKCAYDSERNCKNDNPDKKCLSQDVDGVKCWYSQPKTCSEQGYKNTPCATDEDSGTVPNTLEASDGPCYKCTPKKECKYISNLYYGPNDTCPQYTDRKDAGVTGKDGVCSTCEPQACTTINTAYKNAANQNTCGSNKEAKKVTGTDSAADGPCYTCENTDACTYEYARIDVNDTHASKFSEDLYRSFQNRTGNTKGASYYWKGPGSFEQNYDYSGFQMYSRIDENSKSCQKGKKTAYETICPGTAKVACKRKFVSNGCSSEPYVEDASGLTVEGAEFGYCSCDTSKGLYDTEKECSAAKLSKCTSNGQLCYQTCESAGKYSTEDACKKAAPKYTDCHFNGSCYVQNKKGWEIHYTHKAEDSYARTYKCTKDRDGLEWNGYDHVWSDWDVAVYETGTWNLAKDLDDKTHWNIDKYNGEGRYPAGEYRICFRYSYSGNNGYIWPDYIHLAKTNGDACDYRWNQHDQQWHPDDNNKEFCSDVNLNTISGSSSACMIATFEDNTEYYVQGNFNSASGWSCTPLKYTPY